MIANRSPTSKATLPTSPIGAGCTSVATRPPQSPQQLQRGYVILQATRREIGCLVDHSGLDVLPVRGWIPRTGTDRIVRDAKLDRLGFIEGAGRDRGLVDHTHELARRLPEERNRGH